MQSDASQGTSQGKIWSIMSTSCSLIGPLGGEYPLSVVPLHKIQEELLCHKQSHRVSIPLVNNRHQSSERHSSDRLLTISQW